MSGLVRGALSQDGVDPSSFHTRRPTRSLGSPQDSLDGCTKEFGKVSISAGDPNFGGEAEEHRARKPKKISTSELLNDSFEQTGTSGKRKPRVRVKGMASARTLTLFPT